MTVRAALGVTLCAVSSVALEATVRALEHCLEQVRFDRALLLSHVEPTGLAERGIAWRQVEPMWSRRAYSRFVLHQLADHVTTSHVLLVQWDGFVRDGTRWDDEFLEYDYIGAVWPQFDDEGKVGNGGFSLRSRRLLEATRQIPAGAEPEDVSICRTHRHMLERSQGIRFGTIELARRFAYEREPRTGQEFGFHGSFNLPAELSGEMTRKTIASLEPGVLGSRESVDLFVEALLRKDWPLARLAFGHVRSDRNVIQRIVRGLRRAMREKQALVASISEGSAE